MLTFEPPARVHKLMLGRPSPIDVALASIVKQSALVARLSPGSRDHKLASEVLFALQDSCAVLLESHVLLEKVRRVFGRTELPDDGTDGGQHPSDSDQHD